MSFQNEIKLTIPEEVLIGNQDYSAIKPMEQTSFWNFLRPLNPFGNKEKPTNSIKLNLYEKSWKFYYATDKISQDFITSMKPSVYVLIIYIYILMYIYIYIDIII